MRTVLALVLGGCLLLAASSSAQNKDAVLVDTGVIVLPGDGPARSFGGQHGQILISERSQWPEWPQLGWRNPVGLPPGDYVSVLTVEQIFTPTLTIDLVEGQTPVVMTYTAAQRVGLLAALARYNATNRRDEPAWNLNQWERSFVMDRWAQIMADQRAIERSASCARFATLTGAEQQAIVDKLGGRPCAP